MGHWVTNDDGEHIYISDGGKVLATRAAISKASGGTERGKALAGRSKAAILKGGGRKTEGGKKPVAPPTSVKDGPQALRDMYAAQSRHKSLQGRLDAGDKGVTKDHVAQAREELKQSRVELLRTKFDQEKQQVEKTAANAKPGPAAPAPAKAPANEGGKKPVAPPTSDLRPPTSVKDGPQALRDMYAAKSRHASLQGRRDAGDKGVTKEHVAQTREDLKQSRIELLRSKFAQEKRQVAQTAAGKPGTAKAPGRGTPERAAEAAKIAELRGKLRATAEKLHFGPVGGARLSITKDEPYQFKDKLDAIKLRVAERGDRDSETAWATRDQARSSAETRRFGRALTIKERMARDAQAGGVRVKREAGNDYAGKRISDVPKSEGLTRARAVIAARSTSQPPARAATPGAAKATGLTPKVRPPEIVAARAKLASELKGEYRKSEKDVLANPQYHRESPALQGGKALPTSTYKADVAKAKAEAVSRHGFMRTTAEAPKLSDKEQIRLRVAAAGNAGARKGLREVFASKPPTSQPKPAATPAPARPSLREQAAAARAGKGTAEERVTAIKAKLAEQKQYQGRRAGRMDLGPPVPEQRAMSSARVNTDRVYARKRLEALNAREQRLKSRGSNS